jgi:hypothetical protein
VVIDRMHHWNVIALPLYWLVERVARGRISDGFRYGWWGTLGSLPNRLLTWWYVTVENRLRPPVGLTLFVIAHRRDE